MLQAMNTGHDGSLTTIHANSPRDALYRLDTMVAMANLNIPERAIRQQIASALQVVVQLSPLLRRHAARSRRSARSPAWSRRRDHDAGHLRVRADRARRPDGTGPGSVPRHRHPPQVRAAAGAAGFSCRARCSTTGRWWRRPPWALPSPPSCSVSASSSACTGAWSSGRRAVRPGHHQPSRALRPASRANRPLASPPSNRLSTCAGPGSAVGSVDQAFTAPSTS